MGSTQSTWGDQNRKGSQEDKASKEKQTSDTKWAREWRLESTWGPRTPGWARSSTARWRSSPTTRATGPPPLSPNFTSKVEHQEASCTTECPTECLVGCRRISQR